MRRQPGSVVGSLILITAVSIVRGQPSLTAKVIGEGSKPVNGAIIHLWSQRLLDEKLASIRTDERGQFGANPAPTVDSYLIEMEGFGLAGDAPRQGVTSLLDTIQIGPAATVSGKLLGPDDAPAVGVKLSVHAIQNMMGRWATVLPDEICRRIAVVTGPDGEFSLPGMPRNAIVTLCSLDDRYVLELPSVKNMGGYFDNDPELWIGPGNATSAGILRLTAAGTITGRIVKAGLNEPAADVVVRAIPIVPQMLTPISGLNLPPHARTDARGRYRITNLPAGDYTVSLVTGELVGKEMNAADRLSVKVGTGQTVDDIDFQLQPGGIIQGRALGAGTQRTLADIGINVNPWPQDIRTLGIHSTRTGADGNYWWHVTAGEFAVALQSLAPAGFVLTSPMQRVIVENGKTITVDFEFSPDPVAPLAGRVVDEEGRAVPEAIVTVTQPRPSGPRIAPPPQATVPDAEGQFRVYGLLGNESLTARYGSFISTAPVPIPADRADVTLVVHPRAFATMAIRVIDENAHPIADARVIIGTADASTGRGAVMLSSSRGFGMISDSEGLCTFDEIDPGAPVAFLVMARGYSQEYTRPVQFVQGGRLEQTVKLILADSFIAGKVVDENGQPLAGMSIVATGGGRQTARSDAEGRFRIEGLRENQQVRLEVLPPGPAGRGSPAAPQFTSGSIDAVLIYPSSSSRGSPAPRGRAR